MGMDTQAVIGRHVSVADVCGQLKGPYGAKSVQARSTHRPDYWVIDFIDRDGAHRMIDLFLNSYAGDDYRQLTEGQSTLVSMELGPTSEAIVRSIAAPWQAWVRRHDGEPWAQLN